MCKYFLLQVLTWFGDPHPRKVDPDTPGCPADPEATAPCFAVESWYI